MDQVISEPAKESGFDQRFRWHDYTWEEIEAFAKRDTVIVIPTGSVEQHGFHLPLFTDTYIVSEIAERAVIVAKEKVPVLLAPTIVFGCSKHHIGFPGTLTLRDETFVSLATEVGESIIQNGFRRLFFLNGHGGNMAPLQLVVNRLRQLAEGKVLCVAANYWDFIRDVVQKTRRSLPGGIAHAGEFETAVIMALKPSLVKTEKMRREIPRTPGEYWDFDWYGRAKVMLGFTLKDLSSSGVLGDPTVATKQTGEKVLDAAVEEIAKFIIAFSKWTWERFRDGFEVT